jgi:hypothetical protein
MANSKKPKAVMKNFIIPFDKEAYIKGLRIAAVLGVLGFGIIQIGWGEILIQDLIMMPVAVGLVAYLISFAWIPTE